MPIKNQSLHVKLKLIRELEVENNTDVRQSNLDQFSHYFKMRDKSSSLFSPFTREQEIVFSRYLKEFFFRNKKKSEADEQK